MISPSIEPGEVAQELQRLLDSPEFRRNRNASAFLKFVVEEALAGRGDRLKAFTIATLALQRDDSFDPQNNSIVRVQATRVRQMLDSHYVDPGIDAAIRITLPRGSYVPIFTRQAHPGPEVESSLEAGAARPRRFGLAGFALAYGLAGVGLGMTIERHWSGPPSPSPAIQQSHHAHSIPLVQVSVGSRLDDREEGAPFLVSLVESIRSGLSAFDHVLVLHDEGSDSLPDYILTAVQRGRSLVGENIAFTLAHRASGAIVWTSNFGGVSLADQANALQSVTQAVVMEVGGVYGSLLADWSARTEAEGQAPDGLACIYSGLQFLKIRDPSDRPRVMACLERDALAHPDDAGASAMLALVLLRDYAEMWREGRGVADLQRALQLARRAYDVAPYRAQAQFALFQARFSDARFEDAIAIGKQALATNPFSSLIRAGLGAAYVARGRYAEGLDLLRQAHAQDPALPGIYAAYVAIGEFMEGNRLQFTRAAMRQTMISSPLGLCVRLLALREQSDADAVQAVMTILERDHPGFAAEPAVALTRMGFTEPLRELLLEAVSKSGSEARLKP